MTDQGRIIARLQFKRRQSEGALVEAPRGVGCEKGVTLPAGGGVWGGGWWLDPSSEFFLFELKMEHFGAVFKLDLTEETRMQLQEEKAIASPCLILATPVTD